MKTSTVSAVLPCTPDAVWASFFDESYLRALYLDALTSRAFAVLEIGEASRKLRIVPKMKLPAPVAKLIGESFAYEEHATLDRTRNEWAWRMVQHHRIEHRQRAPTRPREGVRVPHAMAREAWRPTGRASRDELPEQPDRRLCGC